MKAVGYALGGTVGAVVLWFAWKIVNHYLADPDPQ